PQYGNRASGENFMMDNLAVSINGPVALLRQPANQDRLAGESATFSVEAVGAPTLSFQWQKNGADISDGLNISGSSASTVIVSNITSDSAGVYSVIVSNSFGAVTSSPAVLDVYSAGSIN